MNEKKAKMLRKGTHLTDINKLREDVTYHLIPFKKNQFLTVATRLIKDEPLRRYKRAKQMYKDPEMRQYAL